MGYRLQQIMVVMKILCETFLNFIMINFNVFTFEAVRLLLCFKVTVNGMEQISY